MVDPQIEAHGRAAVKAFYDAWNEHDMDAVRISLNYPHVTYAPGAVEVRESPSEFESPFEWLQDEGWHHSSLDSAEAVWSAPDRIFMRVEYSRYHADGTKYRSGEMIYGVTNIDGHWGIQFRTRGWLQIAPGEKGR